MVTPTKMEHSIGDSSTHNPLLVILSYGMAINRKKLFTFFWKGRRHNF